eukprot:PhM_4_TR3362/c0_g1_i1/m.35356/K08794/CAMK1; calcium/calmodulin-dependent protein kinase I
MDLDELQAEMFGDGKSSSKQTNKQLTDVYDIKQELGHGAYGTVFLAIKKDNHLPYAVKHIDKRKAGSKGLSEVYGEVETLSLLDHQYIVHLEETFDDPSSLYIVMEYVPGGELQQALKKIGRFPEATVKKMVLCLLLAVEYIHRKGIVHRDLKPANCLLSEEGDVALKIADFGFSAMIGHDACLKTFCGTTAYMAPEILCDKNYGKPVDMWAVGVITYVLLSGTYPFSGASNDEVVDKISAMKFDFPESTWEGISLGAREFISKCLVYDQSKRLTAYDALRHVWVQTGLAEDDWEYYGLDRAASPNTNSSGTQDRSRRHGKPARLRWRGAVSVVRAAHRIVYFTKAKAYKADGVDHPATHNFGYMVTGVYRPKSTSLQLSGQCPHNLKVLNLILDMVESSPTLESLDVSNNHIDNLDFIQAIVRIATQHPSLLSINLENNPIPPLAGRALVRLARNAQRLRVLNVRGTSIGPELIQQIQNNMKDMEKKRLPPAMSSSATTVGGGTIEGVDGESPASSSASGTRPHRGSNSGGLLHVARGQSMNHRMHSPAPPSSRGSLKK